MLKKQSAHRSMAVACGLNCTYVVAEEGRVLVSGSGEHGQLGLGDMEDRLRMTPLAGDFAVRVVMVSSGGGHSALNKHHHLTMNIVSSKYSNKHHHQQ